MSHIIYRLTLLAVLSSLCTSLDILFVNTGYRGHITTTSAVVKRLIARGHNVDGLLLEAGLCSKYPDHFRGLRKCEEADIMETSTLSANAVDPITVYRDLRKHVSDNGTTKAFHIVDEKLKTKKYDVVFHDWMTSGPSIAARVNEVPCVVNQIFPFYVTTLEQINRGTRNLFIYGTSNFLAELGSDVVIVASHYTSNAIFNQINKIYRANNLKPLPNYQNGGLQPMQFYFANSIVVFWGAPQAILKEPLEQFLNQNSHFVGYVPDDAQLKPVAGDLLKFIEVSSKPVVYLSLGTFFSAELSLQLELLNSFEKQNIFHFIWAIKESQVDSIREAQLDSNKVFIGCELPQLAIIMHSKVKAYIMHAGANSVQEMIYAKIPSLVFPGIGDQPLTTSRLVKKNLAVYLRALTCEEIVKSLNMLLEPATYRGFKERLRDAKMEMVAFGGYERAADVIELVANGTIRHSPVQTIVANSFKEVILRWKTTCVMFVLIFTCSAGSVKLYMF